MQCEKEHSCGQSNNKEAERWARNRECQRNYRVKLRAKASVVAEPSNLMPPRSARLPLDTKHPRKNTKLLGYVGHTLGENPKIHIFPLGLQMRE